MQIDPQHVADSLPNIVDLRYSHHAVVLFSGPADKKRLFEIIFLRAATIS